MMAAVTILGAAALLGPSGLRTLPGTVRPLSWLFAAIVAWQALGALLRSPGATEDAIALANSATIAMLLPVVAVAARDKGALTRLLLVLFVFGTVAAILSLALYVNAGLRGANLLQEVLSHRLVPFGRARHAILGAGGLAAAFLAGFSLLRSGSVSRLPAGVGLSVIGLTLLLTQSRGPVISTALAVLALLWLARLAPGRSHVASIGLALACFAVPVALVLAEPWLTNLFCTDQTGVCRPSSRQDVWIAVAGMILERPLLGWGPSFRFAEDAVGHAHNGVLGTAFYFGLPVAALFLGVVGYALTRGARMRKGPVRDFALGGMFFAAGFLGSDLPNPFAFFNTHYLFLWLPVTLAVVAASDVVEEESLP